MPLFPGYVFIRSMVTNEAISQVIGIDGVVTILGIQTGGIPIPEEEIESIRRMLDSKIPYHNHPFPEIGQRVRIRGGALDGLEGILLAQKSETKLVVSVNLIHRSIAMKIEGYDVEAL
jgi:transcription antitermination factor NusG